MNHTPVPWKAGWRGEFKHLVCVVPHEDDPAHDALVWTMAHRESPKDDAEFIAWACNNAEGLLAVCEAVAKEPYWDSDLESLLETLRDIARNAIAKAKGEER